MNYITLNGKRSLLIKGLLISELPPITKPLVRTKIEEVDGRDGDIVTKLGYAAYDKKMSIGLFGDFSIDDIIEYFDSEGEVIFSNEPDKFYRYKILNQIDFERLIRFRTATVVFHVQPFKYSAVSDELTYTKSQMFLSDQGYDTTINGLRMKAGAFLYWDEREMQLTGTATESTIEFYIPIRPLTLKDGHHYTIKNGYSNTHHTGGDKAEMRVIKNTPTSGNTAGGKVLSFTSDQEESWTQDGNMVCNYLYVKTTAAQTYDIYFEPIIEDDSNIIELFNKGNVISRPKITIYASSADTITINGNISAAIDYGYITLDCETYNAYKGDVLKNRAVTGDLKTLKFNPGVNTLTFTDSGKVGKIVIKDYSRWI